MIKNLKNPRAWLLYLLGAHVKRLKVVRHAGNVPTPVFGLYMENFKVCV